MNHLPPHQIDAIAKVSQSQNVLEKSLNSHKEPIGSHDLVAMTRMRAQSTITRQQIPTNTFEQTSRTGWNSFRDSILLIDQEAQIIVFYVRVHANVKSCNPIAANRFIHFYLLRFNG